MQITIIFSYTGLTLQNENINIAIIYVCTVAQEQSDESSRILRKLWLILTVHKCAYFFRMVFLCNFLSFDDSSGFSGTVIHTFVAGLLMFFKSGFSQKYLSKLSGVSFLSATQLSSLQI